MNKKYPTLNSYLSRGIFIILPIIALWLGAQIYLQLRPTIPLFSRYIDNSFWENLFYFNFGFVSPVKLPRWLIYSLPSGLWVFAYSLINTGLWGNSKSKVKWFWLSSVYLLAIGWEVCQLAQLVNGTFSFIDILFGLGGGALGMVIGFKLIKPVHHES